MTESTFSECGLLNIDLLDGEVFVLSKLYMYFKEQYFTLKISYVQLQI